MAQEKRLVEAKEKHLKLLIDYIKRSNLPKNIIIGNDKENPEELTLATLIKEAELIVAENEDYQFPSDYSKTRLRKV